MVGNVHPVAPVRVDDRDPCQRLAAAVADSDLVLDRHPGLECRRDGVGGVRRRRVVARAAVVAVRVEFVGLEAVADDRGAIDGVRDADQLLDGGTGRRVEGEVEHDGRGVSVEVERAAQDVPEDRCQELERIRKADLVHVARRAVSHVACGAPETWSRHSTVGVSCVPSGLRRFSSSCGTRQSTFRGSPHAAATSSVHSGARAP